MIVVSDTTPLNYLILIGQIDLLPRLYGQVIVPATVAHELQHLRAPASVRAWIGSPPAWLEIRDVAITEESETLLDAGELAALALAELLHANLLLMDDRAGSKKRSVEICERSEHLVCSQRRRHSN